VEEISGIPGDQLSEAARLYARAPAASILYAMGITQHISGTDNVKSLANLAMLCGNRTTSRAPAIWAVCPMSLQVT